MQVVINLIDKQFEEILNKISIEEAKRVITLLRKRIDQHTLDNMDMPLKDTGLSKRTLKALAKLKITMLRELLRYEIDDIRYLRGIGSTAVADMESNVFSIYKK